MGSSVIQRLATCLATAIALTVVVVDSASAQTPRTFFGVVPFDYPSAIDFRRMASGGVGLCRLQLTWPSVEQQQGLRDWSKFDTALSDASRAGVEVMPQLYGSPSWVNPYAGSPPLGAAWKKRAWKSFVTEVASRYGPRGTFWSEHPEIPYNPVKRVQIWNEVNLRGFWGSRPNPRGYARLLRITRAGLQEAGGGVELVIAGLLRATKPGFGVSMSEYLTALYKVRGVRSLFDAVAIHAYSKKPRGVLHASRQARAIMRAGKDRRKPLFITEVGWSTGGAGWRKTPYRASQSTQALKLAQVYRLLSKNRRRLRLQSVIWHSWRDYVGPGGGTWIFHMGLLSETGSAKPAWGAYAGVAGGTAS